VFAYAVFSTGRHDPLAKGRQDCLHRSDSRAVARVQQATNVFFVTAELLRQLDVAYLQFPPAADPRCQSENSVVTHRTEGVCEQPGRDPCRSYLINFSRLRSSSVQCAWISIIVRNVLISKVSPGR